MEARFKLYEEIRKPRIGRVRDTARKIAGGADSGDFVRPYMQWLAEYDAVEYAREALKNQLHAKTS